MMLKIKKIKARLPLSKCELKFMLKEKTEPQNQCPSQIPLADERIQMDLQMIMPYAGISKSLELCVVAITDSDRIFIGKVNINATIYEEQTQTLKGIDGQDGFIVYQLLKTNSDEYESPRGKMESENLKAENSNESWPQFGSVCVSPQGWKQKSLGEDLEKWILEQKLLNQRYLNRLQENQIFQLKYSARIEKLLENLI